MSEGLAQKVLTEIADGHWSATTLDMEQEAAAALAELDGFADQLRSLTEGENVTVKFRVYKEPRSGALQLEIGDEHGGYRLGGPKFIGESVELAAWSIDARAAEAIARYLSPIDPRLASNAESETG